MRQAKLSERVTIRLSYSEARRIQAQARLAGITPSQLIRRAVAMLTTENEAA